MILTIVLSLPLYFCIEKNKNPLNKKWISVLYAIYFVYFCAVNLSRFSYFASSRMNVGLTMAFFIVIISISMCYGSYLGIESIARFALPCTILLIIAIVGVEVLNISNFNAINFYPAFINTKSDVVKNTIILTSNSIEPVLLLALCDKVNGKVAKPFFGSIIASYVVLLSLIAFCIGVMGAGANLQSFPIFALFQLESIGDFSRLDMFHTAFWLLALLLKTSLLIYCSSISIKKFSHKTKCITLSAVAALVTIGINEFIGTDMIVPMKIVSVAGFSLFAIIIPLISLFVGGRKNEAR
jgi:hypothetical protein